MDELIVATDFSGLGSPEEAFKRLEVNHKIAFACEKDEPARRSYSANHDAGMFYDDVTTRNNSAAEYADFYAFGFPCQAFSISGKRLGFEDTRGTLFFNSLEYISTHRPRVIVAENVKGLLSHDKVPGSKSRYGRTFGVIRDALAITINGQHNLYKYDDCINYHIHFQVLNTKDYGLPQNRERIFIVGFRDEEDSIRFKFPKKIPLQLKLKDLLEKNVPEKYYLSQTALNRLLKHDINLTGAKDGDCFAWQNANDGVVKKEISPTLRGSAGSSSGIRKAPVIFEQEENQVIIDNDNGKIRDIGNVSMSLDANYHKGMDNHGQRSMILENEPLIGAERGRYNKDGKIKQQLEVNESGNCNTITSVTKDNLVIEDDSILFVKENTTKGYTEAEPGDSINLSNLNSTTRRGRVGKQVAQTLDTACNQAVLLPLFGTGQNNQSERVYSVDGIAQTQSGTAGGGGAKTGLYLTGKRIRRLIPLECFRLQGYSDDFFERCASVNSDTQLYKQAGNSISVDTFMHLLIQILIAIKIPFKNG